jgi:hypothetical protein
MHVEGPHIVKRSKKMVPLCVTSLIVLAQRQNMFSVVKGEVRYRREYWAEDIDNLSHGRYLPVEPYAENVHAEDTHPNILTGISRHGNSPASEREPGTAKVKVIGFTNIVQEAWDRKGPLVKECDLELLEERVGHPRKKSFQVYARTLEHKPTKACKGDVY